MRYPPLRRGYPEKGAKVTHFLILVGKKDIQGKPMSTQQPQPHTVAQLAVKYFEAVLTRDSATLKDVYGYSKQDCDSVSPEQQQQAAAKLLATGNILSRKTPQHTLANPLQPLTGKQSVTRATFNPTPSKTLKAV